MGYFTGDLTEPTLKAFSVTVEYFMLYLLIHPNIFIYRSGYVGIEADTW